MKCDECGGPMKTERAAVRRYTVGGLPHVVLKGIEVSRCEKCGKEDWAIPRLAQLHRVLAAHFVTQSRMMAPQEIRFLRKHVGLSTGDFAQVMGVARETVSRWETGAQPMRAIGDRLLRLVVLNHEPIESYEVENLLKQLNDTPAPRNLAAVDACNRNNQWKTGQGKALRAV